MKNRRMRHSTPSSAKSGGERFGYSLEVNTTRKYLYFTHPLTLTRRAADKSESILLGRPICLRDEDCTGMFNCY